MIDRAKFGFADTQASSKNMHLPVISSMTFAHGGQWLTCLEPSTGHYWQVNDSGQLREGALGR